MTTRHDQALTEVAGSTLEQLAFMFGYPEEAGTPAPPFEEAVGGRVRFAGPWEGELWVLFARELLPEVAANMLGLDASETVEEHRMDALREVLNVVCGNLLPRIGGREAVFDIQRPEIVDAALAAARMRDPQPLRPAAEAGLSLDEGWCRFLLLVGPEAP